jgi:polyphosphate kinase
MTLEDSSGTILKLQTAMLAERDKPNPPALQQLPERFLNRELATLAFNDRVLSQALDQANPLMERVRFLSIAASNQEEFFMVRVAGLRALQKAHPGNASDDGLSPAKQLEIISEVTVRFALEMQRIWGILQEELAAENIIIRKTEELPADIRDWVRTMFAKEIFPLLTPIAVDPAHPFPFIPNKGIAFVLMLSDSGTKEQREALMVLPSSLPRFIPLPGAASHYVLLEDVIMAHIDEVFPEPLKVKDHALFRILRDSEIEIRYDADDLVGTFELALKRRRRGNVIRLTVNRSITADLLEFLTEQLHVDSPDVLFFNDLVGMADVAALITFDRPDLLYKPFTPRFPERIQDFDGDCFAAIKHKDILVHHPYESFDVVVQFLHQAAKDPSVISIKQTIYRTSRNSPIVEALIEAAEHGKSVTALVELNARFDEEANLRWARDMERAGVQVVFGFAKQKTHAKVSLVVRREGAHVISYVHFGTGNYHPVTAKVYTDLSFFTCDPVLCHDAALLFNYMTSYAMPKKFEKLSIAPVSMRTTLMDLIDQEIAHAREGRRAQIWAKCNALVDKQIIDRLYEASAAGVEIDLIVRGVCTLRPQVPGMSDNINVKSIVGRYLEHSRVYCFASGEEMPSMKAKVFISSGDLMHRNLDHRIETLVPITNQTVHRQILEQIMVANLKDQRNSWVMQPDGSYIHAETGDAPFDAHEYFMRNPSLSGRGRSLQALPAAPRLDLDKRRRKKH